MITILVLEDESKVYKILSEVLEDQGYQLSNDPQAADLIKVVKRGQQPGSVPFWPKNFLDFQDVLLHQSNGNLYKALLEKLEKPLIEAALNRTEGNQLKAAKLLGLNRNTLYSKMKRLHIHAEKWKK
ncbi:MAG: hypothetical protein GF333_02425 [Candidatus Omnitrophica bacterium]|nr:hypothetical protein [Candidatus Omnitrophota bacterium]